MAVLRSRLTKLVNDTEFALVFIATGIVETLGSYVVGIVANAIYARTLDVYPGIIFFILAGICIIPLGLNGYVWNLFKYHCVLLIEIYFRFLLFVRFCKRKESVVIDIPRTISISESEPKSNSSIMETKF